MVKNAFVSVVLLLLLSAGGAYGEEKVFRAVPGQDGVQRAEVVGGSYFFSPNHLVVKVGVPVELTVKKEPGAVPHSIVLRAPDTGIDFAVALATEPKTVRFTPTKVGKYQFFCDKKLPFLESHRDKGMRGLLEVIE
ncbi:cupredoxin domain-containing protein [Geotalea sp. SG265]|uniref:cupredoxin domain-containing protein n=1 Tax=Geotalea sp. SG265 TaxID=2922867 RepID=UPI001FAFF87C|nr:cupredoxin domain-containing protein [Geotalea sp. SG265]